QKPKLFYDWNKDQDYGLTGTAIIGFDYYIYEKKINELQELNRMIRTGSQNGESNKEFKYTFLNKKTELIPFLKANQEKFRIFINDDNDNSVSISKDGSVIELKP
ncbi:MAG: hypothetical protein HQK65_06225, partial [Desulfamplus sp.]|nr:hypothetical protein [Desulfamplus sp.]